MSKKNIATYKEFGKMLREVANLCAKYGDTLLEDFGPINIEMKDKIYFITNKHDYEDFIQPWIQSFMNHPFDVTEAKKWADYVTNCRERGEEVDYKNWKNG